MKKIDQGARLSDRRGFITQHKTREIYCYTYALITDCLPRPDIGRPLDRTNDVMESTHAAFTSN